MTILKSVLASTGVLAATGMSTASAHTGHGPEPGFFAGAMHFLTGPDHVFTVIMAGIVAAMLANRRMGHALIWLLIFSTSFAIYHGVAAFHHLAISAFDAGFMSVALLMMTAAFGITHVGIIHFKRAM